MSELKKQQKKIFANTKRENQKVFSLLLQWTSARYFDIREEASQQNQKRPGLEKRLSQTLLIIHHACALLCL